MVEHFDYLKLRAAMERVGDVAIDTVVQGALKRKKQHTAKTTPAVEAVTAVPKPKDQPITSEKVSAVAGEIVIPTRETPAVEKLPSVIIEEEGGPSAEELGVSAVEEPAELSVEERGAPVVEERGEPVVEAEMASVAEEAPYAPGSQPEPAPEPGPAIDLPFGPALTDEERAEQTVRWHERERANAREELKRAVRKLMELRALALEAQTTLRKYYTDGKLNKLVDTEHGAYEWRRAYDDLVYLDPKALVNIANLSEEQSARILPPEGAEGEIKIAQDKLERARADARDLGISEDEIARIMEPAAERLAGLVDQPPTPQPGETAEQYLEKWALWADALKSGAKAIPKIAWGVVSTLLGVRLAQTGTQFGLERWKRRKEKKAFSQMAGGLETALRSGTGAPEAEHEAAFGTLIQKMQALEARLDILVSAGKLKSEDREGLLAKIKEAVGQAQQQEQSAQATLNKEVERVLHDYFQTKVSGIELGKQAFNTAFLLGGVQTARALGYGAFTALGRAVRARKEYEQKLKVEGRPADFWERERAVLQNLVPQAAAEYAQGATGIWADLFAGRRVSRSEWAQKKMAFGKALSTTFIFAGMAKVAHAEMTETGYSESAQIDQVLDSIAKRGLAATIGNNWLHNLEQLSFGFLRFNKLGELTVADHPDQGFAKTAPAETSAPEVVKTPEQIAYESALQRLEDTSAGKVDFDPATGRIEIKLGEGGYAHIQQALRDIAVLEKVHTGGAFGTLEATQVENAVANLKLLLEGKNLRFIDADKLDGLAHVADGRLIIDNAAKFHEFVQSEILKHAADKITAENLARYDEAVATVNNTSDANWQKDLNVGTGVEAPSAAGYIKVSIDHELVHKAEIDVAQHEAAEFAKSTGIKAHVDPRDVEDENNYTMRTDEGQAIPIVDRHADILISYIDGKPYTFDLLRSFKTDDPYFADNVKINLQLAHEQALEAAGALAPPEGPEVAAGALPTTFSELVKIPASEGGLVSADGTVHLGEVKFPPRLLEKIADTTTATFVDDAMRVAGIPWYKRFSDEAHAIRALANTIEKHFDPGLEKVGDQIIRYKDDFDRWMRSVPKELGKITDISGV